MEINMQVTLVDVDCTIASINKPTYGNIFKDISETSKTVLVFDWTHDH